VERSQLLRFAGICQNRGALSPRPTLTETLMIYLTRKCEFSASHYYHNPELSAEENCRLYGKCANLNGHGHNYTLEVTVRGEVDPTTVS